MHGSRNLFWHVGFDFDSMETNRLFGTVCLSCKEDSESCLPLAALADPTKACRSMSIKRQKSSACLDASPDDKKAKMVDHVALG